MDVPTPLGAVAAPGLVYTTKDCTDLGGVHTPGAWAVSGRVYTLEAFVLQDSIRETRSNISWYFFFEILMYAEFSQKRSMNAECALKKVYLCLVCTKKGLSMLSVR
jgi:hypothetical protein